jgi:hypothetical protein
MLARFRPRLTFANVVSMLALFVALGGTSYAVTQLPDNSVGTKQLKKDAVVSAKVKDNSLTGADLNKSKLGKVPLAASADNAGNANTLDNKDSTAFGLAGAEPWQFVTLNDGFLRSACYWTNYGGGYNDAEYFRDRAGVVHLKGVVKAADGTTYNCGDPLDNPAGQAVISDSLPLGYRPDAAWAVATISNNAPGRINVENDGIVAIELGFPTFANAKQWVSLDGISFRCAPSGQNGCP